MCHYFHWQQAQLSPLMYSLNHAQTFVSVLLNKLCFAYYFGMTSNADLNAVRVGLGTVFVEALSHPGIIFCNDVALGWDCVIKTTKESGISCTSHDNKPMKLLV